jgi:hypothetical protein
MSRRFSASRGSRPPIQVCPVWRRVGHNPLKDQQSLLEGGETMRTYERPTLTPAGSFKKVTGMGGHGPKDFLVKKQLL